MQVRGRGRRRWQRTLVTTTHRPTVDPRRLSAYAPLLSRPPRVAEGGIVYHALNRAVARHAIFEDDGDYAAFERVLAEALGRDCMRLLAYCIMPNHFHLVLWPRGDGDLLRFLR
jgi:hypothetical protein